MPSNLPRGVIFLCHGALFEVPVGVGSKNSNLLNDPDLMTEMLAN